MIAAAGVVGSIISYFRISTLKTGVVTRLNRYINKKLVNAFYLSEGLLKTLKEKGLSEKEAKEAHPITESSLEKYRDIYTSLEKVSFFNNPETKQLSEDVLNNLYEIEGLFRVNAFLDTKVPEDKKLTELAAHLSLS